jgi:hypothetical protein
MPSANSRACGRLPAVSFKCLGSDEPFSKSTYLEEPLGLHACVSRAGSAKTPQAYDAGKSSAVPFFLTQTPIRAEMSLAFAGWPERTAPAGTDVDSCGTSGGFRH